MQRCTARWATAAVAASFAISFASAALSQASDAVDTSRLQHAFAKARRGEPVTVAVIGGSITAGALASTPEKNYGSLVAQWWRKTFPKAEIHFVNAGIGATGSNYGALRVQRDVLARHPDVIITEYSVNDPNTRAAAETYEGLVRQLLAAPNRPAVLMLFMMGHGGRNAQEWHAQVGRHYHLPMVSMRDALWPEIAAGRAKWDDYEADQVHPNDRGHAYTAALVIRCLEELLKQTPADDRLPPVPPTPPPRFGDLYEHTALFEAGSLKPIKNDGWTLAGAGNEQYWKADRPGSRIAFELEGRAILLMDFHIRGPMGKARVQVDDRPPLIRDTWFSPTWGGYRQTDEVARDLPPGKHRVTIEILPEKNPESTGHEYRLFGLGAAGVDMWETQDQAIAAIRQSGGTIVVDQTLPGKPVIAVDWREHFPVKPVKEIEKVPDEGLRHVRALSGLKSVDVSDTKTTDAGLKNLEGLTNLVSLDIALTEVTDSGLIYLDGLTNLRKLNVARTDVTDAGLRHVGRLTRLESLSLASLDITDAGLQYLTPLHGLRKLVLANNKLTDAGLKHLAQLTNLQSLDLAMTLIAGPGLEELKGLTHLQMMDLSRTPVTGNGLQHLKELRRLKLWHTKITDAGLAHIRNLTQLRELSLGATRTVGDAGLEHLRGLNELRVLDLRSTRVTSRGLEHLKDLPHLERLLLSDTDVDDSGLECLKAMKQLRSVDVSFTKVTPAGAKTLGDKNAWREPAIFIERLH